MVVALFLWLMATCFSCHAAPQAIRCWDAPNAKVFPQSGPVPPLKQFFSLLPARGVMLSQHMGTLTLGHLCLVLRELPPSNTAFPFLPLLGFCVCLTICMDIYIHIYICIIFMYIYKNTHLHVSVCIFIDIAICIGVYIYIHTYLYVYLSK